MRERKKSVKMRKEGNPKPLGFYSTNLLSNDADGTSDVLCGDAGNVVVEIASGFSAFIGDAFGDANSMRNLSASGFMSLS